MRGLHMQLRRPQGKLVKAVVGEIFDVAVGARPGSPSYGQWAGARLSGDNFRHLYIPRGVEETEVGRIARQIREDLRAAIAVLVDRCVRLGMHVAR